MSGENAYVFCYDVVNYQEMEKKPNAT